MTLDLSVTDLFCGAGGSSQGAVAAGATLRMAANHWALAIETHQTNFPDAGHDCADISQVEPRRYPRTDILLASPECTNHSQAKSHKHVSDMFDPLGDPSVERSRATMWDVVRFTEQHRYQAVVVENVVEVAKWAPFDAWLMAMDSFGYDHRLISLNSMIAAPPGGQRAPQSRDRLYMVFWRRGNTAPVLEFPVDAWCATCAAVVDGQQSWKRPDRRVGKYRQQYIYTCPTCYVEVAPLVSPAAVAIDWDLLCPRIGDRVKPLADATIRRIESGLAKFGPITVQQAGNTYERPGYIRAWPVGEPMKAQTGTLQHGVAVPAWMVSTAWAGNGINHRDVLMPFPTQTGRLVDGLAVHPFIAELRGGSSDARSVGEPMSTVSAGGNHHGLVMPGFYMKNYGDGSDPSMSHEVTEPLGAITTQDHHSLVTMPFVSTYNGTGNRSRGIDEQLTTQTGLPRHALVMPEVTVEDCGFRMFEPHEVQAGMGFDPGYVVHGNKRDRVKQLGNAVTPPAMTTIVRSVIESLAGAA